MIDNSLKGYRIDEGELIASINKIAKMCSFCDITGFGELEWIELTGEDEDSTIVIEGPFQLLNLTGRLRTAGDVHLADYVCTVSRHTDNGIQLLGGKLINAEVIFAEITITPLAGQAQVTSAPAQKPAPRRTAKIGRQSPSKKMEMPLKPPTENRWAQAVAESDRIQQAKEDGIFGHGEEDIAPVWGDIVNHRQFGKCDVVKMSDDHISLKKPDGRVVQLGLTILKFKYVGSEGDKNVFSVEVSVGR